MILHSAVLPLSFREPVESAWSTGRLALSGVASLALRSAAPFPSPPRHLSESSIDKRIISLIVIFRFIAFTPVEVRKGLQAQPIV